MGGIKILKDSQRKRADQFLQIKKGN